MPKGIWRCVIASAMVASVSACGIVNPDADPLEARLGEVRDSGSTVALADLTDFAWDELHLFNEYAPAERIEKTVGAPVIGSDFHGAGSLLVFEQNGAVVRTVTVSGDFVRADQSSFARDVLATGRNTHGVRLVPADAGR